MKAQNTNQTTDATSKLLANADVARLVESVYKSDERVSPGALAMRLAVERMKAR